MTLSRKICGLLLCILTVLIAAFPARAAGEVDPTFSGYLTNLPGGIVNRILVQPEGKVLAAGNFRFARNLLRAGLVRFSMDGTIDTSFQPPVFYNASGTGGTINSLALQPDGKILVGGDFQGANGVAKPGMMRLNTDGSIDQTFNVTLNSGGTVLDIVVLADGRLLIAGNFTINDAGGNRIGIARLNSNGSLDSIVYQNIVAVSKLLLLSDGRLIAGSATAVRRYTTDGSFDPTYGSITLSGGTVQDMYLTTDGKIFVGGSFTVVNSVTMRGLFRTNPEGGVDTGYNSTGTSVSGSVYGITPTPGGKLLIFGAFSQYTAFTRKSAALIDESGVIDQTFNFSQHNYGGPIADMAFLPDGRILVGGQSTAQSTNGAQNALAKINTDGSVDTAFSLPINTSTGAAYVVRVQPDGKVLVGGQFVGAGGLVRGDIARFNADGSADSSFTPPNISFSTAVYDIELQADGKIIVPVWAGSSGFTYRLNTNGTVDVTISNTPYTNDAAYLPDGKFLIACGDRIRRYNSNGTVDGTFSSPTTNSSNEIYKMAVRPDGKIIVVGAFTTIGGQSRGRIARLNADGSLDTTFNAPGGANADINAVLLQADGKILIGGAFTGINFDLNKKYLARLNEDGSIDASFATVINAPVLSFKGQANGKILIGGAMNVVNGLSRTRIARLNSDGTLDPSFDVGSGADSTVWSVDLQPDGKVIYGGQFSSTNGITTMGVGRLLNSVTPARTAFDYDGDGKADVSVFRASENNWYILRSSDFGVTQAAFAVAGDVPAPADFDGDGKTDVAIFRPSNGNWWSLSSVNGQQINAQLGQAGDIPLPSDFDGDGRADYVVFRPSTSQWLRTSSANGTTSNKSFGLAGDKPVIGDFDGDGKSDVAIYRPSDGNWWWQSSVDNVQRATKWGISTDIPAPADYDGDGKADFAVFRPSTGVWYIYNSATLTSTIGPFGLTGDKPVPADFDGDGKADIAVYRPSDGIWYLLRSTTGFTGFRFGIATDTPTQNAFLQ